MALLTFLHAKIIKCQDQSHMRNAVMLEGFLSFLRGREPLKIEHDPFSLTLNYNRHLDF